MEYMDEPHEKWQSHDGSAFFIAMRVLGLEPKTYGLKSRCSTN
jgi:hypothetical protein